MRKLSLNILSRRLTIHFSRRRGPIEEPLLPTLDEIKSVRAGSKFSRVFRHIFEQNRVKKLLGGNIAFAILMTSVVPVTSISANGTVEAEDIIVRAENTTLTTSVGARFPVETVHVNQGYRLFHPGIDLEGRTGDEVRPFMAGVVAKVQYSKILYGNAVYVDHGNGLTSLYAHLSKITVKEGQKVDNFTKLGEVGSTGRSTGDHLHFEVHKDGRAINPMTVLPTIK